MNQRPTARLRMTERPGRLAAGLGIGLLMIALDMIGIFYPLEVDLQQYLMASVIYETEALRPISEVTIILSLALCPAVLRIDQPRVMFAYSFGVGFVYLLIVAIFLLAADLLYPITAPIAALVFSSGALQSMSWSDERRQRHQLEALERMKQTLTDMLVHDLRKRVGTIRTSLKLLQQELPESNRGSSEVMDTIRVSSERLMLLTSNLLEIRKLEEQQLVLHRKPARLQDLVRECLREHQSIASLTRTTIVAQHLTDQVVTVDPSVFSRVLANLLWNAFQHAPSGSDIMIEGRATEKNGVVLSIANGGMPIPEEDQPRLFEAFVSAASEDGLPEMAEASTGLGLTFCKMAVEAHGGDIKLESPRTDTGDGVRVIVTLPAR